MKATRLLLLMSSCATLTLGTNFAAPAQKTSSESSTNTVIAHPQDTEHAPPAGSGNRHKVGKISDGQKDTHNASARNLPRSPATTIKVRPKQLPNNRKHSPSKYPTNPHQPGLDKSDALAETGLVHQETFKSGQAVRPASVARFPVSLRNDVRHRGANPAVIGGPVNSAGRNTGAISGTSVHRRP
jgi:hypothetical protein